MSGSHLLIRNICKMLAERSKAVCKTSVCRNFATINRNNFVSKKFNVRKYGSVYEADGKTVARVVNRKDSDVFCISLYRIDGFVLSNGNELIGPTILFPHSIFSWNVGSASDISEDSLIMFKILEPKVDILVFGYGNIGDYTPEVKARFEGICKKFGIKFEAHPTEHAVGVYNFLAEDLRFVAAALIPPSSINVLKLGKKARRLEDILDDDDESRLEEEQELLQSDAPKKLK